MINVWFMYDNHTFARVTARDRDGLIAEAQKLFAEDGCGSLFVRDETGASMKTLDLNGRQLGNGQWGVRAADLKQWAEKIEAEDRFRHRMHA